MQLVDFRKLCEKQTLEYDTQIGRGHNRDAIGHWVRLASYYVAFPIYKVGIKGQTVLFIHFGWDLAALSCVFVERLLLALFCWMIGHFLDNIDGTIARVRGEANPKWGEIDVHLHLIANMIFWLILMIQTEMYFVVWALLVFRMMCEFQRRKKKYSERWGERSRLWYWIVLPTNVNMIYFSYVVFALLGWIQVYIILYMVYYGGAVSGQLLQKFDMRR